MSKILKIIPYELFDSRGFPTVGAKVVTEAGGEGLAVVPSGASTGAFEAAELRDGGTRIKGKGVRKAVENIRREIAPALIGAEVNGQGDLDALMCGLDGTENKSRLGANAILAVSVACLKAAADEKKLPLYRAVAGENHRPKMPRPMMNIINGGAHAEGGPDIQEFMIQPKSPGSFARSMEMCTQVYHTLRENIKKAGLQTAVGDEGGFAPGIKTAEEALELICEAVLSAGYGFDEIGICLDAAASEWWQKDRYKMPKSGREFSADELIAYYCELCEKYPIISIEDGMGEHDFEGFARLTKALGSRIQLVGDDLFVTNEKRIRAGVLASAANAVLIKPNQIGTVSETLSAIALAEESGYSAIISHRSGDSEDAFIADLAVGTAAGQIKTGAPCRSERVAKYNRLIMIEEDL